MTPGPVSPTTEVVLLAGLIFLAAALYSSVGHAGASGYLAAMALFGLAPELMKPTALVLNILVAAFTAIVFYRVGMLDWGRLWPFLLGSIPLAFVGGAMRLPGIAYKIIVGVILILAAVRLVWESEDSAARARHAPVSAAALCGGGIGLLSGLTGTGGGIFLTPLLIFTRWATTREASGISAAFILANSISGLAGHLTSVRFLPPSVALWAVAAVGGGALGSLYGSRKFTTRTLQRLLAVVLLIAGLKLIFVR